MTDAVPEANTRKPTGDNDGSASLQGEVPRDFRSGRLRSLPPFLFNAIDERKRAAIAAGHDVINLGVGDPDQPTPGYIVEALIQAVADPSTHQYPDCYGTKRFLAAAAGFMERRFGIRVDPTRHLVATIGSKEAIAHFPLGVLNPGDEAVVFSPAYPVYAQASILAGAGVHRVQCRPEHSWKPEAKLLSRDLLRAARLMWLNVPCNPTGATLSIEELDRLCAAAIQHDVVLASDLAYSEIYFEHGPISCPSVFQSPSVNIERDPVIEFHSLSKTFNMTGWRLGFAVGHEALIRVLKQTKDNYDSGPFNAVQAAGAVALERFDDPQIAGVRREYALRRDLVVQGLSRVGCAVHAPEAGIFVWARCPEDPATGRTMNSWALCERLIDRAHVVVVPGAGFGEASSEWFRVGLTRETHRIRQAMERLGAALTAP
jgi:LL-diaminopimelate aminotransferase